MNRFVLSLAIVMAFGLVAVAAAPTVSASTAMPTWSAGDFWVYTLNAGALFGSTFNGAATMRYDVVGPDSLSVGGTSVSVWKTKLNVSVSISSGGISVSLYLNGNAYYRQSDLGQVQQGFSATYGGTSISFTTSYAPPQAIQWPLTTGAQFNTTTNVTFSGTGGSSTVPETFYNTVEADQSLTVPAGTFTVTPVKQTTGALSAEYTVYFWSAVAGNYVSMRNYYTSNDTQISSIDMKSYSYGQGAGLSFLGLPVLAWIIIVVVIVVAVAAVVLLRRKKPAAPMAMPPTTPPGMTPMPGYPPQQPPQGPPGPPPQP